MFWYNVGATYLNRFKIHVIFQSVFGSYYNSLAFVSVSIFDDSFNFGFILEFVVDIYEH